MSDLHSHRCMFCHNHLKDNCNCNYSQSSWTDSTGITRHIELCSKEVCQLKFKLENYEKRLKRNTETIKELSAELDEFRILMYGPNEWKKLVDDGTLDYGFIEPFVNNHVRSLDNLPDPNLVMLLVEIHHCVFTKYSNWMGQNRSKIKVPGQKEVQVKKVPAGVTAKSAKAQAANATKPIVEKKRLSEFEKIVKHNMDTFKCTQEQAEQMARALGLQPNGN